MNLSKMKKILFTAILCLFGIQWACSQIELTEEKKASIRQQVNKEASDLWDTLNRQGNLHPIKIEFMVDTFRIEQMCRLKMEVDYSTQGINQIIYDCTKEYDALLNKYYGQLIQKLNAADKKLMQNSQRNWLAFRDQEKLVIEMLGKEEYTGGGSIQSNFTAFDQYNLIKQRTVEIASHLLRVSEFK
jgi:uncharacterized protein YecT (DUF1311 family)